MGRIRRHKITIIGAGATGATIAHWCASKELGDIVLMDVLKGMPQGKALDLQQCAPLEGFDCRVKGTNDYDDTAGSDIIVITAGSARKPGMTREDLLNMNCNIVRKVTEEAIARSPEAFIIVLTNPLDVMCWVAYKASGFPRNRVVGQSGVLDSARFRVFIADELGVSFEDVSAMVLGGHGDSMVPLVRYAHVGGIPLKELLPDDRIQKVVERTRFGGGEIVELMGTSAFYAPGAAVTQMVEAILRDKKRVIPCSAYLDGEYGESGIFAGVPVILGGNGVEKVIELELDRNEASAFAASCREVRENIARLTF